MKTVLYATLLCACSAPALAADVGVSVTVGQPGFYGQIDIGNAPPPQVLYAQPVVVQPAPQVVTAAPIYLHVPPGYERHWEEHCQEYRACGQPVYFVNDDWYNNEYVPRYRHVDDDEDENDDGYRDERYGEERPGVALSGSIGQPGFYGQISIGGSTVPQLIYPQPIVIQRSPRYVSAAPIYLHVPPGHERHWAKHCAQYDACGRPVYFVSDEWYNHEYVPRHRHNGGDEHGRGHGRGHGDDREHGRGDD